MPAARTAAELRAATADQSRADADEAAEEMAVHLAAEQARAREAHERLVEATAAHAAELERIRTDATREREELRQLLDDQIQMLREGRSEQRQRAERAERDLDAAGRSSSGSAGRLGRTPRAHPSARRGGQSPEGRAMAHNARRRIDPVHPGRSAARADEYGPPEASPATLGATGEEGLTADHGGKTRPTTSDQPDPGSTVTE